MEDETKSVNWRKLLIAMSFAAVLSAVLGYSYFRRLFLPNVPTTLTEEFLYIPSGTDYKGLLNLLVTKKFLQKKDDFEWVAKKMSFDKRPIRSGKFKIQPNWTNRQLINHLRIGRQEPVKMILTNERLPSNIGKKVARYIEPNEDWLVSFLTSPDSLLHLNLTPETVTTAFIPNTYEVYWNSSPDDFLKRMIKEKDKFWAKNNRLAKAKELGLTPEEAYTLASIVERESNYNPEKTKIASVYLNRLRIGMKLQADPTCVFASKDFATRRVTNYHLRFKSPYNTYLHEGLPPGPISMASVASIDAVLNADKTKYLYFCAKPNNTGHHAFAKSLKGHNVNVAKFRKYMKQRRLEKAQSQTN